MCAQDDWGRSEQFSSSTTHHLDGSKSYGGGCLLSSLLESGHWRPFIPIAKVHEEKGWETLVYRSIWVYECGKEVKKCARQLKWVEKSVRCDICVYNISNVVWLRDSGTEENTGCRANRDYIRGTAHARCFGDKIRETRQRWSGCVLQKGYWIYWKKDAVGTASQEA